MAAQAEVLLHFAARADHVAKTIRPSLEAGVWVVCDRFSDSTMAYQGFGLSANRADIETLATMVGPRPDLTLVLDVSEPTARLRLQMRGTRPDHYERLDPSFHARVRAAFRSIAKANPQRCRLISAEDSVGKVHNSIMTTLYDHLPDDVPF